MYIGVTGDALQSPGSWSSPSWSWLDAHRYLLNCGRSMQRNSPAARIAPVPRDEF